MKLKNLLTYTAILIPLLLAGCKSEDEPSPDNLKGGEVVFTIVMPAENDGTRAEINPSDYSGTETWADYNPAAADDDVDFDNKLVDVVPMLYSVKTEGAKTVLDKQIGSMTVVKKEVDKNTKNKYRITCKLTLANGKTINDLDNDDTYRFVLIANSTSTGFSDTKNPGTAFFTRHGIPGNGDYFSSIPMYGVSNISLKGISKDVFSTYTLKDAAGDPLSIPMLRSMAKVRVNVAASLQTSRKVKLVSLNVDRHREHGYIVPKKWNEISSVTDLGLSECMNPCVCANHGYRDNCADVKATDNDTSDPNSSSMIRFYLPETYNYKHDGIDPSEPIRVIVKFTCDCGECTGTNGTPHEKYIYIGEYDDDGHPIMANQWDIIRNHIYEFNITGIADNFNLVCEVNIKKWGYNKITGLELGDNTPDDE